MIEGGPSCPETGTLVITTIAAAVLGAFVVKLLDRIRRKDAESEAQAIVQQAQQDMTNRRKEAELEIKESTLQQKTKMESEINRVRDELRERERKLDRRQESVDQKTDHLMKQERIVEQTQRRLAEKLQDADRTKVELDNVLDMQRQTLHEVTGLVQGRSLQETAQPAGTGA